MKKTICVILSLAAVAALALIGASWFLYQNLPEVKAAKAEKLLAEVKKLRNGILELKEKGDIAGAIKLADNASLNPKYDEFKPEFFSQKINLMLSVSNVTEAASEMVNAWKGDRRLAEAAFGQVYVFYRDNADNAAVQAWCDKLLAIDPKLPTAQLGQIFGWKIISALRADLLNDACGFAQLMSQNIQYEQISEVFSYIASRLLQEGKLETVEAFIAAIEKDKSFSAKEYEIDFIHIKSWISLAKKDWSGALASLDKAIGLFSDERLARLSREIFSQLAKNDQKVKIESTAERIIRKSKEYARSALLAARYWIDSCTQSNPDQLPERLGFLIDNNIPADRVCMFYEDKFYNLSKNSSAMRKMCDFGRKLIAKCTSDTNTVNNITLRILDGAFIVGDYASAIEMIEKGVPGKDKSWHELTLPKVKAHWAMDRAMKEKDEEKRKVEFDQAASYFRDFMNVWLKSDKQEEVDPVSGICYSKEWILGYNAGRIGKIYLQIGKGDEAIKAFNEARDYYRKALKIAENDEEALKILKPEAAAFGVK